MRLSPVVAIVMTICCVGCATAVRHDLADARKAWAKKDYRAETADLSRAIAEDPNEPQLYVARGRAYLALREYDRAIADFTQAMDLEPDASEYRLLRVYAYAVKGDYPAALADCEQAIQMAPNTQLSYQARGAVLVLMGKNDRAIADFSHAIQLDPADASLYVQRGFVYGVQGRYADARGAFERAIEINPNLAIAYTAIAWMQSTCPQPGFRDAKDALKSARRADKLTDGKTPWVLAATAAASAESGDFAQAVKWQEKAIAATPAAAVPLAGREKEILALFKQHKPYRAGFDSLVPLVLYIEIPS
jgi:tetratricopeptide (TPR) repeat protein